MSSANILMYVTIGAFVLAAVCLVLAIVLFFRLDIRGVVGDLTGKTVAREVQTMRAETKQSEDSHEKKQIPHGMTTSTNLSKSKLIDKRKKAKEENKATDLAGKQEYMMSDENATTLLDTDNNATTLLTQEDAATTVLSSEENATTLLSSEGDATTLLNSSPTREKVSFKMCDSIMILHTEEMLA